MDALQPHLSRETLEYHWGKHHRGYVDKLNELVQGTEQESLGLEELVRSASGPVFNNAAQAWNHAFYWNSIAPRPSRPAGELEGAIQRDFGSLDVCLDKLRRAAAGVFGSGWAWLLIAENGRLRVDATPDAENPLRTGLTPLLTLDVWEHAYYIDYRNERARYLSAVAGILNWDFAATNYSSGLRAAA
jgi:Fe-Mn family superoxide dismutase